MLFREPLNYAVHMKFVATLSNRCVREHILTYTMGMRLLARGMRHRHHRSSFDICHKRRRDRERPRLMLT